MTTPKIPSELSHLLLDETVMAVEAAGRELMKYFRNDMRISSKGKANFVTEADLAAEQILQQMLADADPDAEMMAEESFVSSSDKPAVWVVDPLDGTTNFLHHIPHFAVSVAYRKNDQTELGVIHNPYTQAWYFSVVGQGAYNGHLKMRVSPEEDFRDSLFCFGFFYDRDKAMSATLKCVEELLRQHIHGLRRFGAAALDLAAVADGCYGTFFEFELQPWDMAAGMLMVQEAGGCVTDCTGESISCLGPTSLLATNGKTHQDVLQVVQRYYQSYKSDAAL